MRPIAAMALFNQVCGRLGQVAEPGRSLAEESSDEGS